ncbi:MAG: hypothetical protein AABW57_01145 [Nanoarchaeota archaeon]
MEKRTIMDRIRSIGITLALIGSLIAGINKNIDEQNRLREANRIEIDIKKRLFGEDFIYIMKRLNIVKKYLEESLASRENPSRYEFYLKKALIEIEFTERRLEYMPRKDFPEGMEETLKIRDTLETQISELKKQIKMDIKTIHLE